MFEPEWQRSAIREAMENVSTKSPVALSPAERQPDAYSHHRRVCEIEKQRWGQREKSRREQRRNR